MRMVKHTSEVVVARLSIDNSFVSINVTVSSYDFSLYTSTVVTVCFYMCNKKTAVLNILWGRILLRQPSLLYIPFLKVLYYCLFTIRNRTVALRPPIA